MHVSGHVRLGNPRKGIDPKGPVGPCIRSFAASRAAGEELHIHGGLVPPALRLIWGPLSRAGILGFQTVRRGGAIT